MNLVMIEGHSEAAKGAVILVRGQVFDSDGAPGPKLPGLGFGQD